ncbi:class I SAM-dependent methyltransferase [Candidatus Protochlamydia amoebophila]|nr:SAM-dependent methyltransferase [Candidatus Protochlamydia amoebophila]
MSIDLDSLLKEILDRQELVMGILSSPFVKEKQKMMLRPLLIKGQIAYQLTTQLEDKAAHQNYFTQEALKYLREIIPHFKQTFLYTASADYHILVSKKKHLTILKKPPTKSPLSLSHNRSKNYLLEEGVPISFLIELGIMNQQGKIYPQKQDKFRQINRFLEMVDDIICHFNPSLPIHIVDFGCGKAYLTFSLFYFLKVCKGYFVQMHGVDLKKDVIEFCNQLTHKLGYAKHLKFNVGDVNHFNIHQPVDFVISLHACDTATDAALEKAVRWGAKVILSVPCCQHELFRQVKNEALDPLLKHGILKERFAALATDAVRVQLLEALGYQTQIMEFIDVEHTPKNLLIRAIKQTYSTQSQHVLEKYRIFKEMLNIIPSLEQRFQKELFGETSG